MMKPLVMQISK